MSEAIIMRTWRRSIRFSDASFRPRAPLPNQRRCYGGHIRPQVTFADRYGRNKKLVIATITGVCLFSLICPRNVEAEGIATPAVRYEQARRKARSPEENRDLLSSQHLQVKKSWENPGVYAWGSNSGRVVAPDSDEATIKTPTRITYFDDKAIRDIKLDRTFGAAVLENGDLVQWGVGFSPECRRPIPTLVGKNLIKISISKDRIIALCSNGTLFSISASHSDQISGPKIQERSWIPYWTNNARISYRILTPGDLSWTEKVSDISSGLEHCMILTSSGRLFTAASGTEDFPSRGQLGVPGLTWGTRPPGSYDQPHEVSTLKGFNIKKIASGDYHSLALDAQGRVFSFGDNSLGQLGFDYNAESPVIDAPSLLPVERLYKGTNLLPRVTDIAAGGANSFFTIDATRIAGQSEEDPRNLGRITADTWACGQGIFGGLGNGRWTHVQGTPTKIKSLSGLNEYDEQANVIIPIRLRHLSVGSTHAAAIMDNVTYLGATNASSENDVNWGADVLWWGGNEYYQLGTGKRNNMATPTYIPPLDVGADKQMGRQEVHRFQITPRGETKVGGRRLSVEQRVECGRGCTAVYSGA